MRGIQMRDLWWLLYLSFGFDRSAWACAVCGTATAASEKAYIFSTLFLSFIPLAVIGGICGLIYYLYWLDQRKQQ